MLIPRRFWPIGLVLVAAGAVRAAAPLPDTVDFNFHIRPILSDRCAFCHGPDEANREAGLRLDTQAGAFAPLDDGATRFAIVPGRPDRSEIIRRIHHADPDERMPPPEKGLVVTAREKALLRRWIEQGAPWKEHWAFQPLAKPPVPAVDDPWVRNDIDRFVFARLAARGLRPSAPASPSRIRRRHHFDLTGLPPTPAELDVEETVEATVDRLLASPRYGERMAVDWLDAARYADTYGFQVDRDRQVWPWRDWVVRAFNDNLPYDDFLTWQLAGDLLDEPTDDQVLATTFSRLHQQKVEGGTVPEEFRVEYVADRVHTFGTTMLGLTLECARCHDHKFDPVTTREYYQFFAFFQNIDEAGLYSYFTPSVPTPTLALTTEDQKRKLAEAEQAVRAAEARLAEIATEERAAYEAREEDAADRSGLLAHFRFDEDKPGRHPSAVDPKQVASTGGGNRSVEGARGRALWLTGDDAVKLPLGDFRRHQPFSIALWLNPALHHERAVVYRRSRAWTDAASRGYELLLEDGRASAALIHFYPGNAIRVRTAEPLPTNAWSHVTVTYDGSSRAAGLRLYLNGQPAEQEVVRDHLVREIAGGGENNLAIGERFRDKGFKHGRVDEFMVFGRELTAAEVRGLPNQDDLAELPLDTWLATRSEPWRKQLAALAAARAARDKLQNGFKEIMVMRELPEPKPAWVLRRGHYENRGESVGLDTPAFLPPFPEGAPRNRLGLARWLTRPDHPLTARVFVNRVWQMHFGEGLMRTPEDFGTQGALPTHPELLDWLAATFAEEGWDLKALHRRILTSATYLQSSLATPELQRDDPENEWLARGPVFRRPAEMIRDNALAISGLLQEKAGGPPVKAYDQEVSFKKSGRNQKTWRRSLYTYWRRNGPAPVMMALDAVKRDVCMVKRETTSSPLQALVLLNGPQFVEAARVAAENLLRDGGDLEAALATAFRQCTSRPPEAAELRVLQALHDEQLALYRADPGAAKQLLSVGDRPADGKLEPAEVAAMTSLFSALLNHDECVMRR